MSRTKRRLLRKNDRPIRVVRKDKRSVFQKIEDNRVAQLHVPDKHGKRWSPEDIKRVLAANPETDTYAGLAAELRRTDGAIRRVRTWASHILRGEYEDRWHAWVTSTDRRIKANKHDVILIHAVLTALGYLVLPITEQFKLARPLDQPSRGWRGDRTGKALRARRQRTEGALRAVLSLREGTGRGKASRSNSD